MTDNGTVSVHRAITPFNGAVVHSGHIKGREPDTETQKHRYGKGHISTRRYSLVVVLHLVVMSGKSRKRQKILFSLPVPYKSKTVVQFSISDKGR
jgi:hypothetical protein